MKTFNEFVAEATSPYRQALQDVNVHHNGLIAATIEKHVSGHMSKNPHLSHAEASYILSYGVDARSRDYATHPDEISYIKAANADIDDVRKSWHKASAAVKLAHGKPLNADEKKATS